MKLLLSLLFILTTVFNLNAQELKPIDAESEINFTINNFGLSTKGSVKGLAGTISWNTKNISTCLFNISADATTINTNNSLRDSHLKKEEYFNVGKFPKITIQSTKINSTDNGNSYEMEANLTLKGVSKKIRFPFIAVVQTNGILFNGKFEINRKDFGVGGSSISLSNTVKINLNVIAKPNNY